MSARPPQGPQVRLLKEGQSPKRDWSEYEKPGGDRLILVFVVLAAIVTAVAFFYYTHGDHHGRDRATTDGSVGEIPRE